jgi:hypothetical protein
MPRTTAQISVPAAPVLLPDEGGPMLLSPIQAPDEAPGVLAPRRGGEPMLLSPIQAPDEAPGVLAPRRGGEPMLLSPIQAPDEAPGVLAPRREEVSRCR